MANTNVMNFVLGVNGFGAAVAVTGLLRRLDISLELELRTLGNPHSYSGNLEVNICEEFSIRCDFCMQVNLQAGRPVCPDRMSFSLEGQEKHYVKLACGGVEVG